MVLRARGLARAPAKVLDGQRVLDREDWLIDMLVVIISSIGYSKYKRKEM